MSNWINTLIILVAILLFKPRKTSLVLYQILSLVEVREIKTFNNNKAKKIFMAFPSTSLVTLDFRV
jgi:predicted CDP-diglyceride synthetase/phosphatidate cytidylyltransferase